MAAPHAVSMIALVTAIHAWELMTTRSEKPASKPCDSVDEPARTSFAVPVGCFSAWRNLEPEEARFLDTVLHYGRQNSGASFTPASPIEAQHLVGKLLKKWIEHISRE